MMRRSMAILEPEKGRHFVIFGHRHARTLCGWSVFAFYPHTELARINGSGDNIGATLMLHHVSCPICCSILNQPVTIRVESGE